MHLTNERANIDRSRGDRDNSVTTLGKIHTNNGVSIVSTLHAEMFRFPSQRSLINVNSITLAKQLNPTLGNPQSKTLLDSFTCGEKTPFALSIIEGDMGICGVAVLMFFSMR